MLCGTIYWSRSDERRQSCCCFSSLQLYKGLLSFSCFPSVNLPMGLKFFLIKKQPILAKAYTVFHSLKVMKGLPLQGVCIQPQLPSTLLCCSSSPPTDIFFVCFLLFFILCSQREDREPGKKHGALYKDLKSQASHLKFLLAKFLIFHIYDTSPFKNCRWF